MTAPELRRARIAVLGYFFVLGAATATWSARLPAIKEALHLSDGRLGLALFAVPAGAVLTLPFSGRIADRFGASRVTRIAGAACPAALIPIGLGPQTRDLGRPAAGHQAGASPQRRPPGPGAVRHPRGQRADALAERAHRR